MIERRTKMRGSAAGSHVESMHGEPRFEAGLRQAPHVARLARSFQPMRQDDLAPRFTLGPLRLHKHLDIGLGLIELRFNRIADYVEPAGPEVSGDGEYMVIGNDGT